MNCRLFPALAIGLLFAPVAFATECEPEPVDKMCPTGHYNARFKDGCDKTLCNSEAPAIDVECISSGVGGEYQCQVWPQSDSASYSWWSTPFVQVSPYGLGQAAAYCTGDPAAPQPGIVGVTFTSPGGATSAGWASVSCHEEIEN